jgi:hypothetical protein
MKIRGLPRRVGAALAVIAIAFTQLAVSAYACPNMGAQPAMQMADGADCPEMQSAPTNLCHQACAQAPQSHQTADIPVLPPAMDTGLRAQHAIAKVLPQSVSIEAPLERTTSPPLAIALVRFLK